LITVNTRAIDFRATLLQSQKCGQTISIRPIPSEVCEGGGDEHLGQLGSRSTGDLLYAQSQEILLELGQLFGQVILGPTKKIE
jgi:hypothetical protein